MIFGKEMSANNYNYYSALKIKNHHLKLTPKSFLFHF